MKLQPDNSHVVDLAVKIYLKAGMEAEAKIALDRLELIDTSEYYLLRKSTFEYRFGRLEMAQSSAKEAVTQGGKYFFSARVQLVKCYIKNHKFEFAQNELNTLDRIFSGKKNDVRRALRCSLLIANKKFSDSLKCVEGFIDKNCYQCKLIKMKALRGLVENNSIAYKDRKKHRLELDNIKFETPSETDVLDEIEL